jgi:hypothetical protein
MRSWGMARRLSVRTSSWGSGGVGFLDRVSIWSFSQASLIRYSGIEAWHGIASICRHGFPVWYDDTTAS